MWRKGDVYEEFRTICRGNSLKYFSSWIISKSLLSEIHGFCRSNRPSPWISDNGHLEGHYHTYTMGTYGNKY